MKINFDKLFSTVVFGFFAILIVGGIYSCSTDLRTFKFKRDVVAVYWHEYNKYSVAIEEGNEIKMVRLPDSYSRIPIKVIRDVTDGNMWYMCDATLHGGNGKTTGHCEIHIRSIDDVNGAGWNHGKFGSGNTTRID